MSIERKRNWLTKNLEFVFVGFILLVSFTPYLFSNFLLFESLTFDSNTGVIGDTIGGITAPFVNIFAGLLVYLALKEQVKANDLQFDTQREDSRFSLAINELNWIIEEYRNIEFNGVKGVNAIDEIMKFDTSEDGEKSALIILYRNVVTLKGYLQRINSIIMSIESQEKRSILANKTIYIHRNQTEKFKSKIIKYPSQINSILGQSIEEIEKELKFDPVILEYLIAQTKALNIALKNNQ